MVWFYARGAERRSCETRLAPNGHGYELVVRDADRVTAGAVTSINTFAGVRLRV